MLNFFLYFSAITCVIILHAKAWTYYKIKFPNKGILYGYLTGIIGVYIMLAFLPLYPRLRHKIYYKKMKRLTLILYGSFVTFILLGLISYYSNK